MNKKVIDLLYRSFDGTLTPGEKKELNEALAKSQELREEKERILGGNAKKILKIK